jgi:hypothetical protein
MSFRKGLEAVQESIDRSNNRPQRGSKKNFFKWENGESKYIRFLTEGDEIILTYFHEMILAHDGSKRSFVCRQEVDSPCELCDRGEKRRELGLGVAVAREEGKDENGKDSIVDVTMEVEVEDENGNKSLKTVPWVGILQQAPRNFWSAFWAIYDKSGTLKSRDYEVTRRGGGMETQYQPFWDLDVEIPNIDTRYAKFLPDVEGMLEFMSGQEYYDKWLHGVESNKDSGPVISKDSDLEDLKRANAELTSASADYE